MSTRCAPHVGQLIVRAAEEVNFLALDRDGRLLRAVDALKHITVAVRGAIRVELRHIDTVT